MANTTGKKFGGRSKGVPNRKTFDAVAIAEALECDPFEVLINFAKGDAPALGYSVAMEIPPEMRLQAAKEASQYLYPKRKSVEHSGEVRGGLLGQILGEINGSIESDDEE